MPEQGSFGRTYLWIRSDFAVLEGSHGFCLAPDFADDVDHRGYEAGRHTLPKRHAVRSRRKLKEQRSRFLSPTCALHPITRKNKTRACWGPRLKKARARLTGLRNDNTSEAVRIHLNLKRCTYLTNFRITNPRYGPDSLLLSQTPLVGWAGNGGGVSRCGVEKSKKSVRSLTAADPSRAVNGGNWKRVSMNFRIEVVSLVL